eukprot:SAG31_NODE_344_length_17385_cov_58.217575_14_plen_154_part_00
MRTPKILRTLNSAALRTAMIFYQMKIFYQMESLYPRMKRFYQMKIFYQTRVQRASMPNRSRNRPQPTRFLSTSSSGWCVRRSAPSQATVHALARARSSRSVLALMDSVHCWQANIRRNEAMLRELNIKPMASALPSPSARAKARKVRGLGARC